MENNYGINSFESLNIKTYSTVLQNIKYLKFCGNIEIIFTEEIRSFVKIFTCTICPDSPSFCAERIFCPPDLEKML